MQQTLRNGANVNCRVHSGIDDDDTHTRVTVTTPLTLACRREYEEDGSDEIVRILLKAGANARWKDRKGQSAFWYDCRKGNFPIAKALLNHDKGLLEFACKRGITPLFGAVVYGEQADMVQFLLDYGANVHVTDAVGRTILMFVC